MSWAGYEEVEKEVRQERVGAVYVFKFKVWKKTREARGRLPNRQWLEQSHPEALMTAPQVEELYSSFLTHGETIQGYQYGPEPRTNDHRAPLAFAPLPIVVVSYCWETKKHPDPEGRVLATVAEHLAGSWATGKKGWEAEHPASGLPVYNWWGFREVGIFLDWCSLYQWYGQQPEGRTEEQNAAFLAALSYMGLWYAHEMTTALVLWGQVHRPPLPPPDSVV